MAKCNEPLCEREMLTADGCAITYLIFYGGTVKPRIPFGFETPAWHTDEHERCHDCNCRLGQLHHVGCDVERCPVCNNQLISCDDKIFDVIGHIPASPPKYPDDL